jgi:hypothetical protein
MAMRTLSLAVVLLLCGVYSAFPKGSRVIKDDPWDPHHIQGLPAEVRQYIARICRGRQGPNMISQPIRHKKSGGGSTLNISIARAWASFVGEANASMLLSLSLVRAFGSPQSNIETAASEKDRTWRLSVFADALWPEVEVQTGFRMVRT